MMCNKCGLELEADDVFCRHCGQKVSGDSVKGGLVRLTTRAVITVEGRIGEHLQFASESQRIVVGGESIWDLHGAKIEESDGLGCSEDGGLLAKSLHAENELLVWNARTGQELWRLRRLWERWGEDPHISPLVFSPDGRRLVVFLYKNAIETFLVGFDARTGEELWFRPLAGAFLRGTIILSPDGQLVAAATTRGELLCCRMRTGELVLSLSGDDSYYGDVTFHDDGEHLIIAELEDVAVLSIPKPASKRTLIHGSFACLAQSSRGYLAAAGRREDVGAVVVFDRAGSLVARGYHGDKVTCLAFSADGALLGSGGGEVVKVWDMSDVA